MEKLCADEIMEALRKQEADNHPLVPSSTEEGSSVGNHSGNHPLVPSSTEEGSSVGASRAQPGDAIPPPSAKELAQSSGIAYASARVALLERLTAEVGAIILCHRGQANAIKGDAIRALLPDIDARKLKSAIETLRTVGKLPVAATKEPPYGYFIPVTPEEARAMHDRIFGEGIRLIRLSQLFQRDVDLVRALEGQLSMAVTSGE